MGEKKMQDKKVIVTGSGIGIGREVALEFSRQGADVALHYCHNAEGAQSAVEEIRGWGGKAEAFKADFAVLKDVEQFAEEAIGFLGGADALVNNAGITFNKPFFKITPEQLDKLYAVNIRAQFFLTQRVAQTMLETGGGAVCNMTSVHGIQGAPEHSAYAATKGAIIAYSRALSVELGYKGVRINTIAPGSVVVDSYYKVIPGFGQGGAFDEEANNSIPLGRLGTPLDIARIIVFLCSKDAEFILGQNIVADGGMSSLMSVFKDFRGETGMTFGEGYL